MKTSPLQAVKERFGDKEKLVSAVQALANEELWLDKVNDVKGLARVSNAKLLRLHETLSRVKKEFGNRGKLIDAILALGKREKDAGLRGRLEKYPTPRLLDLHQSAARRSKLDAKKAKAKPKAEAKAEKKPRSKKAKAKAKATAGAPKAKAKATAGAPKATKKK
jgi:hypothetical protein